ncbi:MAG: hypothetical protein WD969_13005 [Paracoccaceae bacterium]
MRVFLIAAAMALAAGAAVAASEDKPIPPEAWRELTTGKTVHYYKDGQPFGREYYINDEGEVVFRFPNGDCAEGRWAFAEGKYCFAFGNQLHCFHHVKRGSEIVVIGDADGEEQTVEQIEEGEPLSCSKAVDS